jgi:hypothetical protein
MAKNLSTPRLRKLLATATKKQLLEEIVELFSKFDIVQKHYALRLEPQSEEQIVADYKAHISKAMLPKGDWEEPKVSEARRFIREYGKIALSEVSVADLMLFYVECGVKFLNKIGDYRESFYNSLKRMFEAALKLMRENNVGAEFEPRCRKVAANTRDMGYGFGDAVQYLLDDYFQSA